MTITNKTGAAASEIGEDDHGKAAAVAAAAENGGRSPTVASCSSTAASPTASSNINQHLTREYTIAVQTDSYNEIWSKIHRAPDRHDQDHHLDQPSSHLVDEILQPDRASIEDALRSARPSRLMRAVTQYLDNSERTSHLFLSIRRSLDRAAALYGPIFDLLDVFPLAATPSQSQLSWAFDTLRRFYDQLNDQSNGGNPFANLSFSAMRTCSAELKQQLELRLVLARRKHRLLRRATCAAAVCLVGAVAGAAVTGVVLAAHLFAVVVGSAGCVPTRDLMGRQRERLRRRIAELDAAARGTYVLNNNMDTIERLVARLRATVESDGLLVRLAVDRQAEEVDRLRHAIEEVVRLLRKNHESLQHQLKDLDEHVCLCLAAINRARSLLLQHFHRH